MTSAIVHLARLTGWFLLLAAVAVVLGVTLGQGHPGVHAVNLRPGHGLVLEWRDVPTLVAAVNIGGNIALFAPIGFLLVTVLGDSVPRAVVGGALLSVTIESVQYQIGRAADVDDVLLNTTGALLGAVMGALGIWAVRRLRAGTGMSRVRG